MRKRTMSKAGKITAAISGAFLLLIVVAIILIATFDWNRLKPTINQKVSEIAAVILPALLIVRFLIFFLCQS